jgi:hypothetical protein
MSRLLIPGSLVLRGLANKGGEARFMIFTVKLGLVSSPERSFHREVKETAARASLKTYTLDDLSVIGAWLVF